MNAHLVSPTARFNPLTQLRCASDLKPPRLNPDVPAALVESLGSMLPQWRDRQLLIGDRNHNAALNFVVTLQLASA